MLKEIEEQLEYNDLDYSSIMDMTPFEFNLLRMMFIEKVNKRNNANKSDPNAPLNWEQYHGKNN